MKHFENFKSEYIQGIYDFLEQDADVTDFKRDLVAVAEYKKIPLQDLEAQYFEYHDLMKEDLSDKIVFIFREDCYLGMFSVLQTFINTAKVKKSVEDYFKQLKDGDRVYVSTEYVEEDGVIKIYGDRILYHSKKFDEDWILASRQYVYPDHRYVIKYYSIIPNLITNEKMINELKGTMHFALVI